MSGFTQLNYHAEFSNSIAEEFKKRLDNAYYILNSKKSTITTYYNINTQESTIDPGLQIHYSDLANRESSLRFNKINNCYLYGIGSVELNAAYGDFGIEGSEVQGTCIVLPNTFIPYPNDFFSINYIDKDLLFKVISVTPDTLPNGANFYQLEYILDQHGWEEGDIKDQVVRSMTMKVENFGTNRRMLLTEEELEYDNNSSELVTQLQNYFKDLFYDGNIQSFCFQQDNALFYDAYMIEFIRRNDILDSNDFVYVAHRTQLSKYFNIEYEKSEFTAIETGRMDQLKQFNSPFVGIAVEEITSLLSQHYEPYYQMTYSKYHRLETVASFYIFSTDFFTHIVDNTLYTEDTKLIYNIVINYMNGSDTDIVYIKQAIEKMDLLNDKETFYLIPFLIYIINKRTSLELDDKTLD